MRLLGSWRIHTEENGQDTPESSNIDLLASIHHIDVTLSEQEDTHRVDGKIYQPLIFQEEAQHWE